MGKIVAITGAPRSGKTYLVGKLAQVLQYVPYLEGENDSFPDFITSDIKHNENSVRRILWFRNKEIKHFISAQAAKEKERGVLLDTFWIDYQMYINVLLQGNDRATVQEMADLDLQTLPWPDVVVYLKNDEEGTKKFLELGGRDFDQNLFNETIAPLQRSYDTVLKLIPSATKLISIDRTHMDFDRDEDVQNLVNQILS